MTTLVGLQHQNIPISSENWFQVLSPYVYGSMLIKMLVCLLATFIYIKFATSVSKNAIIACLVLYGLYTIVEVAIITQLLKKSPKNA